MLANLTIDYIKKFFPILDFYMISTFTVLWDAAINLFTKNKNKKIESLKIRRMQNTYTFKISLWTLESYQNYKIFRNKDSGRKENIQLYLFYPAHFSR